MWIVRASGFFFCTYTDGTPVLSLYLSGNKYSWTTPNKDHHTLDMHIHLTHAYTYTHAYAYFIHVIYTCLYILYIYLSLFIYISFLILVTIYLSSHSSAMLLISCHIMSFIIFNSFAYSCHLLLCFMPAYTLEVDTGKNCMYPKVLSL